eukprot:394914_1
MSASESYIDEEPPAVVIDNGSAMITAGFAGDDAPRTVFPCVSGRRKVWPMQHPPKMNWAVAKHYHPKEVYVGDEAISKRNLLKRLQYPIQKGIVTTFNDCDGMEKIWCHTFYNELRIQPEEHCVLCTDSPSNSKSSRKQMTQIMFESFNVPAFYIANQAVLALYESGNTTGIVIDSGYQITHTVPIYEGFPLKYAVNKLDIGGADVTRYLMNILNERGYSFQTLSEQEVIKDYKEKCAYIAGNYADELEKNGSSKNSFELPDGQMITFGNELFEAPEIIFNPKLINYDIDGISVMVIKSVNSCDKSLWKDMMRNVVLCGGNTMFNGIDKRLKNDIAQISMSNSKPLIDGYVRKYASNKIYDDVMNITYDYYGMRVRMSDNCLKYDGFIVEYDGINIVAKTHRKYSAWVGGSIVASLDAFQDQWITKSEYDEIGTTILDRKCHGIF